MDIDNITEMPINDIPAIILRIWSVASSWALNSLLYLINFPLVIIHAKPNAKVNAISAPKIT